MRYLLPIALLLACNAPEEADLRDVRPTKLSRGEKLTIEARGPIFTVGAPTVVQLDFIAGVDGKPVRLEGRAVARDHVLADADERLEAQLGGEHVSQQSPVTVEQTVKGKKVAFKSRTEAEEDYEKIYPGRRGGYYDFDLFPRNLLRLAHRVSDRVNGGHLLEWLGLTVTPVTTGLQITDVKQHFDKVALLTKCDAEAPLDGQIEKSEAVRCGVDDKLFAAWDENQDDVVSDKELDKHNSDDSIAALAGLKIGQVIDKAGGAPVRTQAALEAAWSRTKDRVELELADKTKVSLPAEGAPTPALPAWLILALVLAIAAGLVALPVPVIAGLIVVWERKVSAYMQSRLGPNRVGPGGWLQWLADGLKLLMKEDIVPTEADPILFKLSPYLAFLGAFLTFVVLPFSHFLVVSDLNIGLLFLLSVTSLIVVSIIMGGWSSNSKWALLGGMRSAAQIISYELPASVALLTIATLTGSLSTQAIVERQGGAPWNWNLFHNPFTFCAFFIYFISALAEGNRTPFDLPEAESELVSGYNTEYSGFRFSLFPMVEWVNLFIIGAVATMLFLGGWRIPMVNPEMMETGIDFTLGKTWHVYGWTLDLIGFAIFLLKDIAIIFVIIWIRWTLPRFRVDQMMNLCWKYLIPGSFVCFVGAVLWSWVVPENRWVHVPFFLLFGLIPGAWFTTRVLYNRKHYSDLVLNQQLGRVNS